MNQSNKIIAIVSLIVAGVIAVISARSFLKMHQDEPLYPSSALTATMSLSQFNPNLQGTSANAKVYRFEGSEPGGKLLILGGTHPNEASGYITTYLILENVQVQKGTLYILPRANKSAFTHNDPQEGHPQHFIINGKKRQRSFRYGSRITNTIDQWPDPEIYLHHPSGQKLAGNETRNLNRAYPGKKDGNLTEMVAYAIVNLINSEKINVAFDLHEAAPEYPVVNAIVAAGKSQEIASEATMELQFENLHYSLEPSPYNFHGLSHREWADYTESYPILLETANPMQGRLRGLTDDNLIITGKDKMYLKAAELGVLQLPYDSTGISMEVRVGRHLAAIIKIMDVFSRYHDEQAVELSNLPTYDQLITSGIEAYF